MTVIIEEKMNDFEMEGSVLKKYVGQDETVFVPDGVTALGRSAFSHCKTIKKVVLPESLTDLGEDTFSYCTSLREINIPSRVRRIGMCMFSDCHSLASIKLPAKLEEISFCAFQRSGLVRLTVPPSVKRIDDSAFSHCHELQQITLPPDAKLGERAFRFCRRLADEDGFVIVNDVMFGYFGDDEKVVIPDTVKEINVEVFIFNNKVTHIEVPATCRSIGRSFCHSCANLESVSVLGRVSLPMNFLALCKNLRELFMPRHQIKALDKLGLGIPAAYSFISDPSRYTDGAISTGYRYYAAANRKNLLLTVFMYDNVTALNYFLSEEFVTADNFGSDYLNPALEARAISCTAALLEWKHAHMDAKDKPDFYNL